LYSLTHDYSSVVSSSLWPVLFPASITHAQTCTRIVVDQCGPIVPRKLSPNLPADDRARARLSCRKVDQVEHAKRRGETVALLESPSFQSLLTLDCERNSTHTVSRFIFNLSTLRTLRISRFVSFSSIDYALGSNPTACSEKLAVHHDHSGWIFLNPL